MAVFRDVLEVGTRGAGLYEITPGLRNLVRGAGLRDGIVVAFVRHTSASLVIQENADPRVGQDLVDFFADLVPETRAYAHDDEGPDDMPAHIRAALTHTSEVVPFADGELALGTWQGLYLFEHRRRAHRRRVEIRLLGE
jgi:secondary thiamine-phosphate synthase enzyme